MNNYFLVFNQHFDRDKGQDWGRLSLNQLNPEPLTLDIWVATSSYASLQKKEDFHFKGGLIPPQYRLSGKVGYTVESEPINLPQKGVEGNFYKINPFKVTTDRGAVRGDFGIHRDANIPGSLGCIVLQDKQFADFESVMRGLKFEGKEIPLFVFYS